MSLQRFHPLDERIDLLPHREDRALKSLPLFAACEQRPESAETVRIHGYFSVDGGTSTVETGRSGGDSGPASPRIQPVPEAKPLWIVGLLEALAMAGIVAAWAVLS